MLRLLMLFTAVLAFQASAGIKDFKAGPVFSDYGKHAPVPGVSLTDTATFKVAFDAMSAATPGSVNPQFDSLARFINMHVANGVPEENISLALVVHGGAALDMLTDEAYQQKQGQANATRELVEALLEKNVRIIMCGQTFVGHSLTRDMLIDGVEVALSAMTAHAQLQQQGYTLNPF